MLLLNEDEVLVDGNQILEQIDESYRVDSPAYLWIYPFVDRAKV